MPVPLMTVCLDTSYNTAAQSEPPQSSETEFLPWSRARSDQAAHVQCAFERWQFRVLWPAAATLPPADVRRVFNGWGNWSVFYQKYFLCNRPVPSRPDEQLVVTAQLKFPSHDSTKSWTCPNCKVYNLFFHLSATHVNTQLNRRDPPLFEVAINAGSSGTDTHQQNRSLDRSSLR